MQNPAAPTSLDSLVAKHTAFSSLPAMLHAQGDYYPSIRTKSTRGTERTELTRIANAYDAYQAVLGDSRRAYRS